MVRNPKVERYRRLVVIIKARSMVGLIKRIRDGSVYYAFPGGVIEKGETPEEIALKVQ